MRKKKQKTIRRRVLQFRLSEADYSEIARAAAADDLTISQEAARRLSAYPHNGYHVTLSMEQRTRLLTAAKTNHVPLGVEMTRRISQSLDCENVAASLFGGLHTMKFATRVAGAILRAEQRLGRAWYSDTSAIIETKAAVMQEMTGYVQIESLGFLRAPNDR